LNSELLCMCLDLFLHRKFCVWRQVEHEMVKLQKHTYTKTWKLTVQRHMNVQMVKLQNKLENVKIHWDYVETTAKPNNHESFFLLIILEFKIFKNKKSKNLLASWCENFWLKLIFDIWTDSARTCLGLWGTTELDNR